MKSEFGKGLCYNLGLFLAHAERNMETYKAIQSVEWVEMWFNAAADHLYDIQSLQAPRHLRKRVERFAYKCIRWRNSVIYSGIKPATEKDVKWALQEAKDLLRLIDKANGITVQKGIWE